MAKHTTREGEIIDFGAHLYPKEVFPGSFEGSDLVDTFGDTIYDPEVMMDRYEEAGIDSVVLSQPFYMGNGNVSAVSEANDALLDIVRGYDNLYGLAAIPVAAGGTDAAAELERCLEAGYNGGALETRSGGITLVDDDLESVFDVAERHRAPLLVHPKLNDSVHPDVLDDDYELNATIGREVALCESVCRVIHDGVLDDHPDLDLVFHHYGGNIASMLGRIHAKLAVDRFGGGPKIKSYADFKSQLEERVHVDTCGFFGYQAPLQTALGELPATNVLFATDHPFEPLSIEDLRTSWTSVGDVTSTTAAEHIFVKNARRMLANVD